MTLNHILFGSNVGLRALNKIVLYWFLYFLYLDVVDVSTMYIVSHVGQFSTDILVNVNFTCIGCCPIFLISHQIHGTPNTRFFYVFFQNLEEGKTCIWCGAISTH